VALSGLRLFRGAPNSFLSALMGCTVCLVSMGIFLPGAAGQQERGVAVEGYITATHPSGGFEINGTNVTISPSTGYRLFGEKKSGLDGPLRDAAQVGAYVFVEGPFDRRTRTATAKTVVFRDDWDQPLVGVGVIDKVASAGPQPVFRADGYLIRISSFTKCSFHGDLKTLSDVGVNTWLRYQAKRTKDGVLDASAVSFFVGNLKATKATPDAETVEMHFEAPDLTQHRDGNVNFGLLGKPHALPADTALQERVMHAGAEVVPAYQKAMPDGSRFKIAFRFYAIDDANLCLDGCDLHGGLILISRKSVERLKSDSQLAAVLAECVVNELQHQASRQPRQTAGQLAVGVAEDAGVIAISPLFVLPLEVEASFVRAEMERLEQRQRLALAMLDDAGYDPWQAPEAWRLLAPKVLPQDLDSLKYPNRSEYQLGILNLQYGRRSGEPVVDSFHRQTEQRWSSRSHQGAVHARQTDKIQGC